MELSTRTIFILQTTLTLSLLAATIIGLTLGLRTSLPPNGGSPPWPRINSESATFRAAAVTSNDERCNAIATKLMGEDGGSTVDAAIAVAFCIGVVNPDKSGIGGGDVISIKERQGNGPNSGLHHVVYMSRERAPLSSSPAMFVNGSKSSTIGGSSVGVPGEVMGLYMAWKQFGRLPWRQLVQPAIDQLKGGAVVSKELTKILKRDTKIIIEDPDLRKLFTNEDKSVKKAGDRIFNDKLVKTLETIARSPMEFYNGTLANNIVDDINERGGNFTADDLKLYAEEFEHFGIKDPVRVNLSHGNYILHLPPFPTSGPLIGYILNILNGYKYSYENLRDIESHTLTIHQIVEALKFAFAKRGEITDPMFYNQTELLFNLTDPEFAEQTRRLIDNSRTHEPDYYGYSVPMIPDSGTATLSVYGAGGSAVSLTASTNLKYGARFTGSRTGIFFNNVMDDFSTPGKRNRYGLEPSPINYPEPKKMPTSSMCAPLVSNKEGKTVIVTGAAGGPTIISTNALVILKTLWFGKNISRANVEPRFHHQLIPNKVYVENQLSPRIIQGLRSRGHNISTSEIIANSRSIQNLCEMNEAAERTKCILAVGDIRRDARPRGL